MLTDKIEEKLKKIINPKELFKLQDFLILEEAKGKYQLFNKYHIQKQKSSTIQVTLIAEGTLVNEFENIKHALAWCIYEQHGKYYQAAQVLELERKLIGIELDIQIHKRLFARTKQMDDKLIYLTKLNEDKLKKAHITKQLFILITDSLNWQRKLFNRNTAQ